MKSLEHEFRSVLDEALAVLFPIECSGCSRPDTALCDQCVAAIPLELQNWGDTPPIIAATSYTGVARAAVLDLKEHGRTSLAAHLAPLLQEALYKLVTILNRRHGAALAEYTSCIELVVPPQTPAAKRRRGYHPVEELLKPLGYRNTRVLKLVSVPEDQRALSATERSHNMQNRFAVTENLTGRAFITVDDVMTTGATLNELGRVIQQAGGWHLGSAVLCHTPRKIEQFLPTR